LKAGFYFFDENAVTWTPIALPGGEPPVNRFNDGRTDPSGRFWAGTMSDESRLPTGALYCLDADRSCRRVVDDVILSNGLCWSPDGATMYHADSWKRTMWRYRYDQDTGAIFDRRIFFEPASGMGAPDGAVTDSDGFVWLAMWGGSAVLRLDPNGNIERKVDLPVTQPTCPCFGGKDLGTLYVTSAAFGLDPASAANQPNAGGIFALDLDVRGLPSVRYRG
jgi:sugar lactone lactonase YvrE